MRTPPPNRAGLQTAPHAKARGLAGLLAAAGTLHFLRPKLFTTLIPPRLPGTPRGWVLASGAAELGCAVALAHPRTRRYGATASAVLFAAVFPGNIQMALDYHRQHEPAWLRAIAYARLPLQWPLISLALRVRHAAAPATPHHRGQ